MSVFSLQCVLSRVQYDFFLQILIMNNFWIPYTYHLAYISPIFPITVCSFFVFPWHFVIHSLYSVTCSERMIKAKNTVQSVSWNAIGTIIYWLISRKSIRHYTNIMQVINNKNNTKIMHSTSDVITLIRSHLIYVYFPLNCHVTFLSISFDHQFEMYSA